MNNKNLSFGTSPSKIREIFEYGNKRKIEIGADKVFDFSIGNPSVPVPKIVNDTLIELIKEDKGVHLYTSNPGDMNVRNAVAEYLNKTYGCNLVGKHIFMTCGAAASLSISFNALLNKGEEVILFAPYFSEYRPIIENAGGVLNVVKPNTQDFSPDFDDFEKKINENTRVVLINTPNNPTGAVYSEEVIKKMSDILRKKEKEYNIVIYLLSDEPYRELIYDDTKYPFITNYYDDSIVCYSYSKCLSLPGERIGYIAISENCYDIDNIFLTICGSARALGFICAPSLFQHLLERIQGVLVDINIYKTNRDILYQGLKNIGYDVIYPKGAFYLFMKALEDDANKFLEKAKEYELLFVPSDTFGYPGYVRVSYCVTKEQIEKSLPLFEKLFRNYQK